MTWKDWAPEAFRIDLNSVRDGNRVVALIGLSGPQRVPEVGDSALAIDEDGYVYDADVEAVFPDSRVYLRVRWLTKRVTTPPLDVVGRRPSWSMNPSDVAK